MTNEQVIKAFLERRTYHSANLHSDGTTLKSYALPIAKWSEEGLLILDGRMPSQTTTIHRNSVMRKSAFNDYKMRINL